LNKVLLRSCRNIFPSMESRVSTQAAKNWSSGKTLHY
jgi:hypothetical protein